MSNINAIKPHMGQLEMKNSSLDTNNDNQRKAKQ